MSKLATQFTPVLNPDGARGMLLFDPSTGERQKLSIAEFFDKVDAPVTFSQVAQVGGDQDTGEELTVSTADSLGFSTIALFRNTQAVGNIGGFAGFAKDTLDATRTYSRVLSSIVDPTSGAQVGGLSFQTLQGSTALADALSFSGADATFSGETKALSFGIETGSTFLGNDKIQLFKSTNGHLVIAGATGSEHATVLLNDLGQNSITIEVGTTNVTMPSLAGTGPRNVVVDANGKMSAP